MDVRNLKPESAAGGGARILEIEIWKGADLQQFVGMMSMEHRRLQDKYVPADPYNEYLVSSGAYL